MSSNKSISNPFSTGGGGTNFEQKVGTMYLVFLLAKLIPYGIKGIIKEVRFQQLHTELLDDLTIITEDEGKKRKLSLQIKHNINFRKSNSDFTRIISDCWRTLKNETIGSFDPEIDRFGIGLGVNQQIIGEHIIPIRNLAWTAKNGSDFYEKMNSLSFASEKKEFVSMLEEIITETKGSKPTQDELWQFLKCFEIINFELEHDESKDLVNSWNILLDLIQERNATTATSLFNRLYSIVSNYNPSAGTITYQQLRNKCGSFPLIENPDFSSDIKQLKIHTKNSLQSIRDVIAEDIQFKRNNELNKIRKEIHENEVLVLHGEPLIGKSVLIKMLSEDYQEGGECIVFQLERLENNSLQSFLHQLNISNDFEDILHSFRNVERKCIVIDGLEHTTDSNKRIIVNDILIAVKEHNNKLKSNNIDPTFYWKVICSSRTLDIDKILLNLETSINIQNHTLKKLKINGLEKDEKEEVVKKKPNLKNLILNKKLQELFSRPGILDLATLQNFPIEKNILEQINSESQFMEVFWQHVICRDDGMVDGRGTPIDREKLVLEIAKNSLLNVDKNIFDSYIEYESFKGLELDRIVRRENNSIYFVYDYFEDWAWAFLLKGDFEELFNKIQDYNSLRIIASFRLLSQYFLDVEKNPNKWKETLVFLEEKAVSPRWESEWIASPLLAPNFVLILGLLSDFLIKNENELLTKLLKALRSVCVTYDLESLSSYRLEKKESIRLLQKFAIPIPRNWIIILQLIIDNFHKLQGNFLLEFSKVCKIWMGKTSGNFPLRQEIGEKCLELSSKCLVYSSKRSESFVNYEDEEKFRENMVYSVLHASDIIPEKVDSFLRFHTIPKRPKNHYDIDDYILKNGWSSICRDLPQTFEEVMSSILCESLKPGQFGWSDLHGLGINHDSDWLVPSLILDPFYPFLKLHNEEGLRLILKIINHSTLAWRIREREKFPIVHTLRLDNKNFDLWGDNIVYRWYRFPSLGSNAVCCALMALEKWLDESIKEGKNAKKMFTNILSKTNCVAVVGVCSSVALANPNKIDMSILVPILENPVFWLMDERRLSFDLFECKSYLNAWYFFNESPYTMNFHKKIASQPQRERKFSDFVPLILLSNNIKLKERLVQQIKNFENNIPRFYKKIPAVLESFYPETKIEEVKRSCRLWSLQADIENYRKIEQDGNIGYYFYPPDHFTEEDKESTANAEEHIQIGNRRIWAYKFLNKNEIGSTLTIDNGINYAKELENALEKKDDISYFWGLDFITNLAAALIVRKWDFIVEKNLIDWCESKIITAGKIKSNETEVGINPESFDRAVAYSLPYLYKKTKAKSVKGLLKSFSQHSVNEVGHVFFKSLQILWDDEPKFVWQCINDLVKSSTGVKKLADCDPMNIYSSKLLSILLVIPNDQKLLELKEAKNILKLMENLLDFTIKAYLSFQKKDRDYNEWHHFEWNRIFFALLANTILRSDEKTSLNLSNKIFTNWKKSPGILEEFLRQFLLVSMKNGLEQQSYSLFHNWCEKLIQSDDLDKYLRYHKKEILGLLIFDDPFVHNEWKSTHNFWLEKHVSLIEMWCEKFGKYGNYFPSLVKMLNSIGFELILEYGIKWIHMILSNVSDSKKFLKDSRITSELDNLLWKIWEKYENEIKQNADKLNQYSFLVDVVAAQEKPLSISLQKSLEKEKQN